MECSHKILLCDKAFTFPEEKHYSRQPLDDFQDMSLPMTTFVQPRNPAALHCSPHLLRGRDWLRVQRLYRFWAFASFRGSILAANLKSAFACLKSLSAASTASCRDSDQTRELVRVPHVLFFKDVNSTSVLVMFYSASTVLRFENANLTFAKLLKTQAMLCFPFHQNVLIKKCLCLFCLDIRRHSCRTLQPLPYSRF